MNILILLMIILLIIQEILLIYLFKKYFKLIDQQNKNINNYKKNLEKIFIETTKKEIDQLIEYLNQITSKVALNIENIGQEYQKQLIDNLRALSKNIENKFDQYLVDTKQKLTKLTVEEKEKLIQHQKQYLEKKTERIFNNLLPEFIDLTIPQYKQEEIVLKVLQEAKENNLFENDK
ncbi:MAG: hypothetical protein KatS3mg090_0680 [Patescibacteria group bacterium]|nr:MAG: hypothetical protein KatS3mg090_0680 [Patescibacteria group bacterium]